MVQLKILFGALVVFAFGAFLGVKVVDNNQSVYTTVEFGERGKFTIGKQVDLTNLSGLHHADKALVISGIQKLHVDDEISKAIIELEKNGEAMFVPKQFKVKLHVTEDRNLPHLGAAICKEGSESSYQKVVTIFDHRENSNITRAIRVGVWNTVEDSPCFSGDFTHVWVNPGTAELLYNPNESFELDSVTEIELFGRVSESCKI